MNQSQYNNNFDPLGLIPDIKFSTINIAYCVTITIAALLMLWSAYNFRASYDDPYSPIEALIEQVDCNKMNVNNHENEYHCVIGIRYNMKGHSHTNSMTFIDNEPFYKGDKIIVMVSKKWVMIPS